MLRRVTRIVAGLLRIQQLARLGHHAAEALAHPYLGLTLHEFRRKPPVRHEPQYFAARLAEEHTTLGLYPREAVEDPEQGFVQHVLERAGLAQGERHGIERGQFVRTFQKLLFQIAVGGTKPLGHLVEPLGEPCDIAFAPHLHL